MGDKMRFTVAGDMLIQRRIPEGYEGFEAVRDHICKGDARFFNMETTLHDGEFPGNQFNGGSYLRATPKVLDDAKMFGFNMTSFANNHSLDYGQGGLLATKKYIDEAGIPNTGAGSNLDEASAPVFLDTKNGRVALISTVSTLNNDAAMAGQQSRRIMGRPGVNGLRFTEQLQVTKEQLAVIRQISDLSKINAQTEIERAEGYHPPLADGVAVLKDLKFVEGPETKYITHPHPEDMARIEKAIYEAQMMADYIMVSVHSHELSGDKKETPSDFLVEFAHKCIDAGAHMVIGHGPHLLRPMEIYKGRPIFYSLGDFVIHNECIPFAPEEMFHKQGLTSDATMRELFENRSAGYTRGLMRDHRMLEAMIPYFEMEEGQLTYLELMPIELNFEKTPWQKGNPRFSAEHGIMERFAEMCKPWGVDITIDDRGYGIVKL
ncbi:MAG: CapA family protein [Firmicutes bacterium]|nr:CapA family protein [Bacillota bacterium]